jgi:predicted alpha-1,2-mannosidase
MRALSFFVRTNLLSLLVLLALVSSVEIPAQAKDPVDYIDPMIGTGQNGKTYPGAATPGGMVQLSPDTITGGDNGSGYRYYHKTIQGFSFTHMTGVGWYGDLGNFLVMPTTGPLKTWYGETDKPGTGYLSAFSHGNETAQAGYYAVTLDDYQVRAEMTAAPHSGILRFTFPENPQSRIQIDLARRVGGTSLHQTVKVTDDHTIEGSIECTPQGGGWGHGGGHVSYTLYYHAEFSRPFQNFGVWSATLPPGPYSDVLEKPAFIDACTHAQVTPSCKEMDGQHIGFYAEYPTHAGDAISVKVGISFVSIDGARNNLAAEIPAWDFDNVRQQARQLWMNALDRLSIEGGTEDQKTAFYTSLYHALLDPQILADLNGDYPGGDGKVHPTTQFTKRTIFSGWDVYRSEFPLLTLIAPQVVSDTINSFIELADQNNTHYFDRWELLNAYTQCMNGNPTVVVIDDAYQKGIRNYDVTKAYDYSVNSDEHDGNGTRGYVADAFNGFSQTMECANDDWNVSHFAAQLGKTDDAAKYAARSQDYHNLFDPSVPWTYNKSGSDANPAWHGWFHAKDQDGNWTPWEGLTSDKGVQEATVYEQGWAVPQDVPGLIQLLGGKDLFLEKLNDFFDRTPDVGKWNNYYNQPNEPVHLVPFLFNRAGAPWLTQKWIRVIDDAYKAGPEGLCGDEDVGQMSAWFVLAASGLSQACPGDLRYDIFTPLFDKVTFRLDPKYTKGGTFTITTQNNSAANVYIQSATLNGQPLNRCWLTWQEITAGGTLDLVLGPTPNQQWGLAAQ